MIAWSVGRNVGGTGSVEPISLPVLGSTRLELVIGVRRIRDTGCGLTGSCSPCVSSVFVIEDLE